MTTDSNPLDTVVTPLESVAIAMSVQLDHGHQFYAFPVGGLWLTYYNGPARVN